MRAMNEIHSQDLNDVLTSARMMFAENKTSIDAQMFRAALGGLFCEEGAAFGDKLTAYESNAALVPEILIDIAVELDRRISKAD